MLSYLPSPSSLGQLRAEWKAGLWVLQGGVGVGSLTSIGKPVFGSLCCRISWLRVALPSRAARLSWWNQVVRPNSSGSFCYVSVGVEKFARESSLSALKFQQLQLKVWQTLRGE